MLAPLDSSGLLSRRVPRDDLRCKLLQNLLLEFIQQEQLAILGLGVLPGLWHQWQLELK